MPDKNGIIDEGDAGTEAIIKELEKRIDEDFGMALLEITTMIWDYFKDFRRRDEQQRKLRDDGKITDDHYKQWRLNQIGRGGRFTALRDKIAARLTETNELAISYVNDALPAVYALNRNYTAFAIDRLTGGRYTLDHGASMGIDFTLWDEHTVRRLIKDRPDLMPYSPEKRAIDRGIDLAYGKLQITKQITSSILSGDTIKQIADRLQERIATMSRASAIRAARTAMTNAQNAGRQDGYEDAARMGITVRKRWIATKDMRTRPEHGAVDGQTVPYDQPFDVGGEKLMFPGDSSGSPGNIYNCRCTMRTVEKEGIEAEPRMMRVRDENGRNVVVPEMTYPEWKKWVEERQSGAEDKSKDNAAPKKKRKPSKKGE